MDSPKKINGELLDHNSVSNNYNNDNPVINGANSIVRESPTTTPAEGKKPLKKWKRIPRDFSKALSPSPDFNADESPREVLDDLIQHKRRIPLPDSSRNPPAGGDDEEKDEFDEVEEGESSVASVESRNESRLSEPANSLVSPVTVHHEALGLMVNAPIFSIGAAGPETSEDRSSKSSTAASAPRSRRENLFGRDRNSIFKGSTGFGTNQRAPRGRVITDLGKKNVIQMSKIEPENSNNSNSNAVSNGRMSDKSVNFDGGENSGEEVRSAYFRGDNGETGNSNPEELDSRFEEEGKDEGFEIPDLDPVVEAVVLIESSQEAFEKELEKWSGIGKEEEMEEESEEIEYTNSSNPNFEIQELKEKTSQLKLKLKETSNSPLQKDYLKQTLIESDFDQLFKEKLESEIQTLVIAKTVLKWERTLEDSKAFVEEQKSLITEHKKMNLNMRELENDNVELKERNEKQENELKEISEKLEILDVKNKLFNTSLAYFVELVLIGLLVVMFLISLLPGSSEDIVPT